MILARYLAREIWISTAFVLAALLSLFFVIDLLRAIEDVGGTANYGWSSAAMYVALQLPATGYLLMPVAALIGTIYALAQFASNSEFTIMRVSGMGTREAIRAVLRGSALLVIATFVIGEFVAPPAEDVAQKLRLAQLGRAAATDFRSGFWIKDLVRDDDGAVTGTRFVNAGRVLPSGVLQDVTLYEFDAQMRLQTLSRAKTAAYARGVGWTLNDIDETRFVSETRPDGLFAHQPMVYRTEVRHEPTRVWAAELDPNVFESVFVDPQKMSTWTLWKYIDHLRETRQSAARHEIALWQKAVYPLAVAIMVLLGLPFAYMHVRSGGVSLKIFVGIMLGVGFFLFNNLAANLGVLNGWPPVFTATLPSAVALALALAWLTFVSRRQAWSWKG